MNKKDVSWRGGVLLGEKHVKNVCSGGGEFASPPQNFRIENYALFFN